MTIQLRVEARLKSAVSTRWAKALDDLQRQDLALLVTRRLQRRDVQTGREDARGVEDWRHGATQRNVGGVKMVGLVHGERLAGGDAGANVIGAGARPVPVGARIEPRRAQVIRRRLYRPR